MSIPESFLVGHHGEATPSQPFDWERIPGALAPDTEQPADSVLECDARLARRMAADKILEILLKESSPKKAWQRAHVLQYSLKLSGLRTQREVALMLKVTPARVNQILNFVGNALDGKH